MAQGQGATLQRQLREEQFFLPLFESFSADPRVLVGMTYPMVRAVHSWRGSSVSTRTFKRRVSSMPHLMSKDRRAVLFPGACRVNLDPDFRLPAFGGRRAHPDHVVLVRVGDTLYSMTIVSRPEPPTADHVPFPAEGVRIPLDADVDPPVAVGLRLRG
ncbi:MAG: hypothetical protein V3W28_07735 [Thermoplasmata archaeon]